MANEIDGVLGAVNEGRRNFLRKLIGGAAFAPPLLASFSLQGLLAKPAEAIVSIEYLVLGTLTNQMCGGLSNATTFFPTPVFDFSGTQYSDNFIDVLRPDDIDAGTDDWGGTNHPVLKIEGSAGAGGDTWATVLNTVPTAPVNPTGVPGVDVVTIEYLLASFPPSQPLVLQMDFLIHRFNNAKGAGLLAYAFAIGESFQKDNPQANKPNRALGLVVSNAGNTDKLQLITVEEGTGKASVLKSVSLGAGIAENTWYRMVMSLTPVGVCQLTFAGTTCQVEVRGRVFKHQTPDPDLDTNLVPVGAVLGENASGIPDPPLTLPFNTRLAPSRIGIVARATGAVVDSSVTNFTFRCVQLNG